VILFSRSSLCPVIDRTGSRSLAVTSSLKAA